MLVVLQVVERQPLDREVAFGALPQILLGAGLGLIDGMPPIKRLLAEQMMFGRR